MRILFIAPRFHTNQAPIVKLLTSQGHEVSFVVQRIEMSEDKNLLDPILCKPNFLYKIIENYKCKGKSKVWSEDYRLRHFIPSTRSLFSIIRQIDPDVVIYREPCMFSLIARLISLLLGVPELVLYTQSPCVRTENTFKRRLTNSLRKILFGTKIYSPVYMQNAITSDKLLFSQGVKFIPFVMEFDDQILTRTYCRGEKINVVDVGKYRDYKDHFVLIDALLSLPAEVRSLFSVSIVGQCVKDEEIEYFDKLQEAIHTGNLTSIVRLHKNVPYHEMRKIYLENDVFILTSKRELASVAVLEAMTFGTVCISTDYNGTASYINPDYGYLFRAQNPESLKDVLLDLYNKKDLLSDMGRTTYQYAKENYSQKSYSKGLGSLINRTI